jgi:hypothetical protein
LIDIVVVRVTKMATGTRVVMTLAGGLLTYLVLVEALGLMLGLFGTVLGGWGSLIVGSGLVVGVPVAVGVAVSTWAWSGDEESWSP